MSLIHYRMLGYAVTLVVHIANLTILRLSKLEESQIDRNVQTFKRLEYRYLTSWTVMLQIAYAALGLFCDGLVLMNSSKKDYKVPKQIKASRDIMFSALIWPCSLLVATVFWSVYIYDRSLIFPAFLDKLISNTSNHILHTAIVPVVIWEVIFRPRDPPRSHIRNLMQLTLHMVVYLCVFYYTYIETGVWLYPLFEVTYGTVHFILIHIYIGILLFIFYYLQWFVTYLIHGSEKKINKKYK